MEEHVLERGVTAARLEAELVERAFSQELAGLDDADAVDQPLGDVEHMGGEDHGAAPARVIQQNILDLARDGGVKAGQRLVENEQLRLVQQAARERRLLLHAA